MRELVIRADAGPKIGLGHVMRCLALAEGWQDAGGNVTFASANAPDPVVARFRCSGVAHVALTARHPDPRDAKETGALDGGWIAVDGYHFDDAYRASLRQAGHRVLAIGDAAGGIGVADAVLNQNGGASYEFPLALVGPRFALIRREFAPFRPREISADGALRRIVLTFGGSDEDNATGRILRALGRVVPRNVVVSVLVGPLNPHRRALEQFAGAAAFPVTLEEGSDPAPVLAAADLAITAAGSTCWELCYMGVAMVAIVVANNQLPVAQALRDAGAAVVATVDDVPRCVGSLVTDAAARRKLADAAHTLVDGRGAERVVEALWSAGR